MGSPADSAQAADVILRAEVRQWTLEQVSARNCCVICLDEIQDEGEARPCQHRDFDYLCLTQWLSQSQKCPLCVQTVLQVHHSVDGQDVIEAVRRPTPEAKRPSQHATPARIFSRDTRARFLHGHYTRRDRYRERHPGRPAQQTSLGLEGRKSVYRQRLFSKHVGSNRMSQYTELTPGLFQTDERLVSRARMWLRRELQVFPFLAGPQHDTSEPGESTTAAQNRRQNHVEFLLEYIVAILKSVDIMCGQAEDMVTDFLGRDDTRLLLHELRAWLRSPFGKLEDWDRAVQYGSSLTPSTCNSVASVSGGSTAPGGPPGQRRSVRGDYWRPDRETRQTKQRPRRHERVRKQGFSPGPRLGQG